VIALHAVLRRGDGRHRQAEGRASILTQKALAAAVDDPIEVARELRPLGIGDPAVIGQGRILSRPGSIDLVLDGEGLAIRIVQMKIREALGAFFRRRQPRALIVGGRLCQNGSILYQLRERLLGEV